MSTSCSDKKRDARAELLFCILFAFLPSRFCRRRRCLKPCANERNMSLRVSFPGALAAGWEKEGELATASLKFENTLFTFALVSASR